MNTNNNGDLNAVKIKNIIHSFKYWPKVFNLLWQTQKKYVCLILISTILLGLAPVISLYIIQELINNITLSSNNGYKSVYLFFFIFIVFSLLKELLNIIKEYSESLFLTLYNNKISLMVMDKSNLMGLEDFEDAHVQDQLKRVQNESSHRSYEIFHHMLSIVHNIISVSSYIVFLAMWKWWAVLFILFLPISSFYSLLKLAQKQFAIHYQRAPKMRESWYLKHLVSHDHSFKEIKIYHLGHYLINRYKNILIGFFQQDKDLARKQAVISLIFFVGINLSVILFLIYQVITSALAQEILIGSLIVYIQAIMLSYTSSQGISNSLIQLCQNNLYLNQLFNFLELKSHDPVHLQKASRDCKSLVEIRNIEKLELRNVSFKYPNTNVYVLKNVNFTVEKGEAIAIVGKNGSGKTTIVKLILQMYDAYEGEIFINDINIRDCNLENVRSQMGVVFQDFTRYELPVRQNIGFGDIKNINNNTNINKVIGQSGLKETIDNLPNGLETQLGKWFVEGIQLSGGQWQRIAIARAYMKNSSLFLLDEPSSSLDPESENQIFCKLRQLIQNKIGIFVTHRYSSVHIVNKIIVLNNGELVESGNHEELMNVNGVYAKLYALQAETYKATKEITV